MKSIVQSHLVGEKTISFDFTPICCILESLDDAEIPPITSKPYVDESDPDIIYQSTSTTNSKKADDVVTIGVHELVLNEQCSVFDNDDCETVFVSVEFLNYQAELETPLSLIKGEPNKKLSFNFQKGFHIDSVSKNIDIHTLLLIRLSNS